jgi:WD40-like Beta Propeller Repeat
VRSGAGGDAATLRGVSFAAAHWLDLPVRERSPEPLGRAEAIAAEPGLTHDELDRPDRGDDNQLLRIIEPAGQTESPAEKHDRRNHTLQKIVGERHLADSRQGPAKPGNGAALYHEDQRGRIADGGEHGAGVVPEIGSRALRHEETDTLERNSAVPGKRESEGDTHQGVSQTSIWLLTLGEKPVARPLTSATASEYSPKFSPDGRWLAYVVDQQERSEVYVRGYPSGEPIPVSASGGAGPVWSRDGKTLFYESAPSGGRALMSVPVSVDRGTLKLGAPSRVVSLALAGGDEYGRSAYWGPEYDVFPNGDFVMLRGPGPGSAREIVLVQHWFEEIKRMLPAR